MKQARIYAFGDSQTYGAWDSEGGWCDRLKRKVHGLTLDEANNVKYQLLNLGIGGEDSRGLLKRFKTELDARHRAEWPPVIILATGENDTRFTAGGEPRISIDEYCENMVALVTEAKKYTDKIILVGLSNTQLEVQPFKSSFFSRELLQHYDQAIVSIAEHFSIPRIDVMSALESSIRPVYYKDGVHLNDHGHKLVAEKVWDELSKILSGENQVDTKNEEIA